MRECRPLPGSRMLESNGFDAAAEKCVLLFQLIDRGVQLCDNRLGLIGEDDQFDIDLLVLACRVDDCDRRWGQGTVKITLVPAAAAGYRRRGAVEGRAGCPRCATASSSCRGPTMNDHGSASVDIHPGSIAPTFTWKNHRKPVGFDLRESHQRCYAELALDDLFIALCICRGPGPIPVSQHSHPGTGQHILKRHRGLCKTSRIHSWSEIAGSVVLFVCSSLEVTGFLMIQEVIKPLR